MKNKIKELVYLLVFYLLVILILAISLFGCLFYQTNNYELSNVDIFEGSEDIKISYTIHNNAELTLVPKIKVELNETCFKKIADKEMDEIPPKQSVRTYITINPINEKCYGNEYEIILSLEDINGKILDKETVLLKL